MNKKKCYRCGRITENWEKICGAYRCWPCGRYMRDRHDKTLHILKEENISIGKFYQNRDYYENKYKDYIV